MSERKTLHGATGAEGGRGGGSKGGGGGSGKGGGFTFTKQMPNFMAIMAGGGATPDLGGIEGALQRHAKQEGERGEPSEREDGDDEGPLVVDAAEALTAKERRKLEAKPAGARLGGSLRFKEGDTSAAAKFTDSAHERVQAEAQRQAEEAERALAREAEAQAEAAAAGKAHVFKGATAAKKSTGVKRKVGATASSGAMPKVQAVKNAKLLSFEDED